MSDGKPWLSRGKTCLHPPEVTMSGASPDRGPVTASRVPNKFCSACDPFYLKRRGTWKSYGLSDGKHFGL